MFMLDDMFPGDVASSPNTAAFPLCFKPTEAGLMKTPVILWQPP